MKRLESLLNGRTFLIFIPLSILFLWGFFVEPIHTLLDRFAFVGLSGVLALLPAAIICQRLQLHS